MPTYTTTYSLGKPVVGADEDAWGDTLNTSLDAIDDILDGTTPVTGIDINSGTLDGVTIGGTTAGAGTFTTLTANTSITGTLATAAQTNVTSLGTLTGLTVSGSTSLAGASTSADITFGDNDKAIFGAGSDLQIYHDGSDSYVTESGTGALYLGGSANVRITNPSATETMAEFGVNDAVTLYYDNAPKLATTSTGIDVTGSISADGLTVDGVAAVNANNINYTGSSPKINIYENDTTDVNTQLIQSGGDFILRTLSDDASSSNNRIRVDHATGDISFYEDTGTTAKLFWDASAESLGLNTTTFPTNKVKLAIQGTAGASGATANIAADEFFIDNDGDTGMTLASANTGVGYYAFADSDIALRAGLFYDHSTDEMGFRVSSSTRMTIDSSGNVGIGTDDPQSPLHVYTGSNGNIIHANGASGAWDFILKGTNDSDTSSALYELGMYRADGSNNPNTVLKFGRGLGEQNGFFAIDQNGSEAMRIDSSGNLLVGQSSSAIPGAGNTTTGISVSGQYDAIYASRSDGQPLVLNRNTSDGVIADFRKDGATVGSIGVDGGRLYINGDNGSSGGGLKFTATDARPVDRTGSDWDNAFDLGDADARFDDIYATNGTIQTSDANEKQDIAELSDAEQRVAVAAKGLLRKFRWKDAVAEKGDEARTHFGIIAQDLQAAFAAEGLDAGDYAMFIYSTWTDEETGEERSRMGVRYSELLAFIIAAI